MHKTPLRALLALTALTAALVSVTACGDATLDAESGSGSSDEPGLMGQVPGDSADDAPAPSAGGPVLIGPVEGDGAEKVPGEVDPGVAVPLAEDAIDPDNGGENLPTPGGAEIVGEEDGVDPEAGVGEFELKSNECDRSRFNCKLPAPHRDRNRIYNLDNRSYLWPLKHRPGLLHGRGGVRGNVAGDAVKVNFGLRREFGGVDHIYAFATPLDVGITASGWIPESTLVHGPIRRMPTVRLGDPGQGDYEATWRVTGGDPAAYGDAKVIPNFDENNGAATDYLRRPGDVVNLLYNLPGSGGVAVDTYPLNVDFKRSRGVRQLLTPLYRPGTRSRIGELHFIYGHIGGRYGWIAREALVILSGPEPGPADEQPGGRPGPPAEAPPPPAEAPPVAQPTCYVRCCDETLMGPQPVANDAACHDYSQAACGAHDHVKRSEVDGHTVWERDRQCWAKCSNREAYHIVAGVESGCTDQARAYCRESDRGGLQDAAWSQCEP